MMKQAVIIVFIVVTTLFINPILTYACPGCNSALNGSVGRGFNTSILFLMAMPFILVGSIAFGLIFMYKKSQNKPKEKILTQTESQK